MSGPPPFSFRPLLTSSAMFSSDDEGAEDVRAAGNDARDLDAPKTVRKPARVRVRLARRDAALPRERGEGRGAGCEAGAHWSVRVRSAVWLAADVLVRVGTAAGIKEGLYATEALAAYLLYRLNVLDPVGEFVPRASPPLPHLSPHACGQEG